MTYTVSSGTLNLTELNSTVCMMYEYTSLRLRMTDKFPIYLDQVKQIEKRTTTAKDNSLPDLTRLTKLPENTSDTIARDNNTVAVAQVQFYNSIKTTY